MRTGVFFLITHELTFRLCTKLDGLRQHADLEPNIGRDASQLLGMCGPSTCASIARWGGLTFKKAIQSSPTLERAVKSRSQTAQAICAAM